MPATNHLGTVYQRKDGRWVAALSIGAGRRVSRYATTRKDAHEALQALLHEHHAGSLVPPTATTLGAWVEEWLTLVGPNLRPNTVTTYRYALAPIVAQLGHQRLSRVTPRALAGAFATLQRQNKGRRSLQQAYVYLGACLNRAVVLGLLGANPLRQVPRPAYLAAERRIWTTEQARRFLAVAAQSPFRHAPLFIFLAGSGCRTGEALALRWSDLDWRGSATHICKARVESYKLPPSIQQPKTRAGVRTVSLPAFVLDALRGLPRPVEDGPVFLTSRGTVPRRRNMLRSLKALCRYADVPPIPLHSLRHLNASLALAGGVPLPDVSRHLGHANPAVTARVYSHALGDGRAVVQALETALAPPDRGTQAAE